VSRDACPRTTVCTHQFTYWARRETTNGTARAHKTYPTHTRYTARIPGQPQRDLPPANQPPQVLRAHEDIYHLVQEHAHQAPRTKRPARASQSASPSLTPTIVALGGAPRLATPCTRGKGQGRSRRARGRPLGRATPSLAAAPRPRPRRRLRRRRPRRPPLAASQPASRRCGRSARAHARGRGRGGRR